MVVVVVVVAVAVLVVLVVVVVVVDLPGGFVPGESWLSLGLALQVLALGETPSGNCRFYVTVLSHVVMT